MIPPGVGSDRPSISPLDLLDKIFIAVYPTDLQIDFLWGKYLLMDQPTIDVWVTENCLDLIYG